MLNIWAILIPILFVDVVNPVLFAFLVYAAGTQKPVLNSLSMLLGHTLAYLAAGIVLAIGLESLIERLKNPQMIDYIIELAIAVLLLVIAYRSLTKTEANSKQKQPSDYGELTPWTAVGLGAVVNFIGIPFALPYFAALDQILKADLSVFDSLLVLLLYNCLYAVPFLIVPVVSLLLGQESQTFLQRVNGYVDRISSYLMPVMLIAGGLFLLVDSLMYFSTGKGLF